MVIAVLQMLGGHWALLQTTAWVSMVVSYSRVDSLVQALEKTFDGEHPCELCKVVKQGRSDEQKQSLPKAVLKMEAVLPQIVAIPELQSVPCRYVVSGQSFTARTVAPPTPPPLQG